MNVKDEGRVAGNDVACTAVWEWVRGKAVRRWRKGIMKEKKPEWQSRIQQHTYKYWKVVLLVLESEAHGHRAEKEGREIVRCRDTNVACSAHRVCTKLNTYVGPYPICGEMYTVAFSPFVIVATQASQPGGVNTLWEQWYGWRDELERPRMHSKTHL